MIGSLIMLKVDYWDLEKPKSQPVWDTSDLIQTNTKESDLIISVTGGDPTLLYLANRNGWLVSPKEINMRNILKWKNEGAKYIAGSWDVIENYNQFLDNGVKLKLHKIICRSSIALESSRKGCEERDRSYLIELH